MLPQRGHDAFDKKALAGRIGEVHDARTPGRVVADQPGLVHFPGVVPAFLDLAHRDVGKEFACPAAIGLGVVAVAGLYDRDVKGLQFVEWSVAAIVPGNAGCRAGGAGDEAKEQ